MKTLSELGDYMWKLYPKQGGNDLVARTAMIQAFDFITGKVDHDEAMKRKLSKEIRKRLNDRIKNGNL